MYVLIVMTFLGGNWTVSMQEFSSQDSCLAARGTIETAFRAANGGMAPGGIKMICQPK
jgi:hypothetical protein